MLAAGKLQEMDDLAWSSAGAELNLTALVVPLLSKVIIHHICVSDVWHPVHFLCTRTLKQLVVQSAGHCAAVALIVIYN